MENSLAMGKDYYAQNGDCTSWISSTFVKGVADSSRSFLPVLVAAWTVQ